ncbi:MAG: hypothetical protein Q8K85_02335, partial [Hyphomicrobium sp.]|nr:hypothetical protein [Hyphomicrobium sp.]
MQAKVRKTIAACPPVKAARSNWQVAPHGCSHPISVSGTRSRSSFVVCRMELGMNFDLIVIGTGTAAMVAAGRVRKAGWSV